jgi:hypothetical protein
MIATWTVDPRPVGQGTSVVYRPPATVRNSSGAISSACCKKTLLAYLMPKHGSKVSLIS